MTPQELMHHFDRGTLDPQGFTHRDHGRVAWHALEEADYFTASLRVARGLKTLAQAAGVPEKFNATVTHVFLSQIAERRLASSDPNAEAFLDANPDVLRGDVLQAQYSQARLSCMAAQSVALLPDMPLASGATAKLR
ncbi:MAG: hypothetical protein AB8B82_06005 [Roseovarius sp.]